MRFTSSLLMIIATTAHCATTEQFEQLFSDQKIVAAREARADRKANRESTAAAEVIAAAKAEEDAIAAEAIATAEAEAATTAAAILAAKKEHIATLKEEKKQEAALNEFSIKRESSTYHIENKFFIKPTATNWLCFAVPAAKTSGKYDNDQRVILKKCDMSDTTQLFIYDATSDHIYPEDSRSYCLGYNVDDRISGNPLSIFECDKVWTSTTNSKHKQWTFTNKTHIINSSNKKCIGTGGSGSTAHVGNMLKQYTCSDGMKQQNWIWVPQEYYKATEKGRNFIV